MLVQLLSLQHAAALAPARTWPTAAAARHRAARCQEAQQQPFWFDPLETYGLDEDRSSAPGIPRPVLIVLPGLDGSSITAWAQYPEVGLDYDLRALAIPPADRSTFDELCEIISAEVERSSGAAAAAPVPVYLLGESMGAGVALNVAAGPAGAALSGLVLVSPATGWDLTWLGGLRSVLVQLPGWLLSLIVSLTSYQLLDVEQLTTTVQRVLSGGTSPLLQGDERTAYAWRVIGDLPTRLSSPAETIRHRLSLWVERTLASGTTGALSQLELPVLLVAGTADARVPAQSEAERIAREAPAGAPCTVDLVEGAGHAGVTDDRLDLRSLLNEWRGESERGAAAVGRVGASRGL